MISAEFLEPSLVLPLLSRNTANFRLAGYCWKYDYNIAHSQGFSAGGDNANAGPDFNAAVRDQLGLKLTFKEGAG